MLVDCVSYLHSSGFERSRGRRHLDDLSNVNDDIVGVALCEDGNPGYDAAQHVVRYRHLNDRHDLFNFISIGAHLDGLALLSHFLVCVSQSDGEHVDHVAAEGSSVEMDSHQIMHGSTGSGGGRLKRDELSESVQEATSQNTAVVVGVNPERVKNCQRHRQSEIHLLEELRAMKTMRRMMRTTGRTKIPNRRPKIRLMRPQAAASPGVLLPASSTRADHPTRS